MNFKTLISTDQLAALLDHPNLVIIDCRFSLADTSHGRTAYKNGHIPGAFYAHLDDDLSGKIIPGKTGRHPFPAVDDLVDLFSHWGIDEQVQVVAYDQNHGGIAARLWALLKWLGHDKVAVLDGGFNHWMAGKNRLATQLKARASRVFTPRINTEFLVDVRFMEKHLEGSEYLYVDSRAAERYRGENEPIDPVAGHIPGAHSLPFLENLGKDGLFLKKKELAKRFLSALQVHPSDRTVFYCGSGVTACHNLLAMHHLGLMASKLYPGSWSEWIVDNKRRVSSK